MTVNEPQAPESNPQATNVGAGTESGADTQREEAEASGDTAEPARPAEAAPSTGLVYCVRCGSAMGQGDRFCHACGKDVYAQPPPLPPARVEVNPSDRNRLSALLLCLLLGWLGAHRFYAGKVGTGLLWLFTLGFLGIGVIYDLVLIATGEFRDIDDRHLVRWE